MSDRLARGFLAGRQESLGTRVQTESLPNTLTGTPGIRP